MSLCMVVCVRVRVYIQWLSYQYVSGRADGMFTALNVDILLPRMNSGNLGHIFTRCSPNLARVIFYNTARVSSFPQPF